MASAWKYITVRGKWMLHSPQQSCRVTELQWVLTHQYKPACCVLQHHKEGVGFKQPNTLHFQCPFFGRSAMLVWQFKFNAPQIYPWPTMSSQYYDTTVVVQDWRGLPWHHWPAAWCCSGTSLSPAKISMTCWANVLPTCPDGTAKIEMGSNKVWVGVMVRVQVRVRIRVKVRVTK